MPFSWALQTTLMQQTVDTMQSAVTKAIGFTMSPEKERWKEEENDG